MPSKQDVAKSNISPVLFMTVEGEPMSFFLCPGPVKCELQPLITAGGGRMCKVQQPGAILLIDPKERGSINEANAHRYVSTQYIHDCVEKEEQLNVEDYRLNPGVTNQSAKPNSTTRHLGGRQSYTSEDDAAILKYVNKHKSEVGGNRLWQEMAKKKVTSHSWQSMKYRYRARLSKKQSDVEEETSEEETEAAEGESKVEENQETDVEKPSSVEDAASPQVHSAESNVAQVDSQSLPADSKHAETTEAQAALEPQEEEEKAQHGSPQIEEQLPESEQLETVEADISNLSPQEEPILESEADLHLYLTESMEPEREEEQTVTSTQKESVPEDSPAANLLLLHESSFQKETEERHKAPPELEQPQRRLTRRQLQLEESFGSEPYSKKLRSSSSSTSSSPQPQRKIKQAVKSSSRRDLTTELPPAKRARGKCEAAMQDTASAAPESQQEKNEPAKVQETAQPDAESSSVPQQAEKKKTKKLGILEAATKEFEDESESDTDETPDLQTQTERVTEQPTSSDPTSNPAAAAPLTQPDSEPGPSLKEVVPETQTPTNNSVEETGSLQAEAAEPAAAQDAQTKASNVTCRPHLFIFDSESQEEDSQSVYCGDAAAPSNPQTTVNKDAPYSLTQVQLEEDKKRITELMKLTNQDLASVTKALLKTSGDFSAAQALLLNPGVISRPVWDRHDDNLLLSADPEVRQQLQEKYDLFDI
ncbi:telomeric repeat-binding factor 2-interacting protein 1 isoform X2 [Cheilinus undulatus]|uniref:telomeric repeat-binding factor 2-interacting protein 1 isoform X2 n=1 Tax=Cheilinus undulatus TaxID=241271 RepID=UPI001BD4F711|nr:telomeric repeat-binding factor 2-interacting protein 1 isoform X2 [Cheilinus undulatus]